MMNRFLKPTLTGALAVALSFGFASCGEDDDDDGIVICPAAVTYVPTNFEVLDKDGTAQEVHGYEYNDKYLLTKYSYKEKDKDNKWVSSTVAFNYGEKGKLKGLSIDGGEWIEIEYDEETGNIVNSGIDEDDKFVYTLDEKGYPTKAYNDHTKVTITYKYDANRNITERISVDESDKDNPITSKVTTSYTNTFSPYAYLKIPTWYTLDKAELLITTGLRMPIKETYTSEGETEEMVYNILQQKDNFPTEIKCTSTKTNKGGTSEVTASTYKIEYKEIK